MFYYILLEPVAGLIYTPFLLTMCYSANLYVDSGKSIQATILINLIAWTLQFVGHGVFEKRSPAFFDNLAQAFLMAPLFVFIEVLFVLGYRPNFRERIDKQVDIILKDLKKKK